MVESGIFEGSCADLLADLPEGCADLVFADPPFGIAYKYDRYDDRTTREQYLAFADRWARACLRVLSPTGSLWVAIGDEYVADYKLKLDALGLTMRNWCVWHYTFGVYCEGKFGRDHTHLLYYVVDPDRFAFNADDIRVPSARQAKYGDKRAGAKGRVPGDVWTFSRVCGTFKERNRAGHKCQQPEALVERVVRACSDPGDLVLDPFGGSFTTAAVAKRLGRRWWSCDLSPAYVAAGRERVSAVREAGASA